LLHSENVPTMYKLTIAFYPENVGKSNFAIGQNNYHFQTKNRIEMSNIKLLAIFLLISFYISQSIRLSQSSTSILTGRINIFIRKLVHLRIKL